MALEDAIFLPATDDPHLRPPHRQKAGLATRLQSGVMRNIMDEEQRGLHVDRIARNPFVGDLIPGTGGASRQ